MFNDHRFASKLTVHIVANALERLNPTTHDCPTVWINVTSQDLLVPEFVFDLQTTLTSYAFDWQNVVIEVSEASILGKTTMDQTFQSLQEMRRRGAKIALDDYGTGYASLTCLQKWPVDIIKLDPGVLALARVDQSTRVIVDAFMTIARGLHLQVLAEGIETQAQLMSARAIGCALGQGYLFAKPNAIADLSAKEVELT